MDPYYIWVFLLFAGNALAWFSSIFLLPGNWVILALATAFAAFAEGRQGQGVGWRVVVVLLALAVLGEVIEFVAGAAGAARRGASRRAMVFSVVGALAGSTLGLMIGIPVPFIGSIVAAIVGGGVGAFVGAFLGETWKGRSMTESAHVGTGAFIGRLLGTVGKLWAGAVMVVIVTWDSFY